MEPEADSVEKRLERIAVLGALARAWKLTWPNRRPLLLYGFGVAAVSGVLLSPLFSWLLYRLLSFSVEGAVVNFDLAAFAASLPALLLLVVWSIVVAAMALIGLGGPVLILTEAALGRRASFGAVAQRVLRSLPRAAVRGAIRLTLLVVLAAPLAGLALAVLSALALLPFGGGGVTDIVLPDNFIRGSVVLAAVLVLGSVCFYFFVRWSFCLHFFLVEKRPLGVSIGASVRLVKGRFWAFARILIARDLIHGLAVALIALLLGTIHWAALTKTALPDWLGVDLLLAILLVLDAIVMTAVVTMVTANSISLLTVLYLRLREEKGLLPEALDALAEVPVEKRSLARRRPVFAALLILVSLALGTWLALPDIASARAEMGRDVKITAHRGNASVAPENTLVSIRAAIDEGADYSEIDILEAKDGTLVVIHDLNLKRLAGLDKNVSEMTGLELSQVDVGALYDERFRGEMIPTLEEAIRTAGTRIKLNIELKVYGHEKQLAENAVATIHSLGFRERCVVTSLDASMLASVRRLDPGLPLGIILSAYVGRVSSMDVDFYSVNSLVATDRFIRAAHADGRDVHVWTMNKPEKIRAILDRFPDNIITDYPTRVREAIEGRSAEAIGMAAVRRLFRN